MIVDREKTQKLYAQVYEILKKKIESGEIPVDSQLPTEENLCELYRVSKATIRLALAELARQGYIKRIQGRGTFVTRAAVPEGLRLLTSLREFMVDAGIAFTTQVLAQTVTMPTEDLQQLLDVGMDQHLIYIKRSRHVDAEAVLIQETYVPHHLCPALLKEDVARKSMIDLLEHTHGITITTVRSYFDITRLSTEEADIFRLPQGSAALVLTQLFLSGEKRVMYTRSVNRPDRFKLSLELERRPT